MPVPPLILVGKGRAARREMDSGQGGRLDALHGFLEPATWWRVDGGRRLALPTDVAARFFVEGIQIRLGTVEDVFPPPPRGE